MEIEKARSLIKQAKKEKRTSLDLLESRKLLGLIGVPLNRSAIAKTPEEAIKISRQIEYPLALKIVSPDIVHKTEAGGVILGIKNEAELKENFNLMLEHIRGNFPGARINGILLEEMLKGYELIIGTLKDPVFENLLMFGIGGVLVELYNDVSFRLIPLTKIDCFEMMNEIKAKEILNGFRNSPVVNRNDLAQIMLNISRAVEMIPEIISMEVNPLVITNRGLVGIDARVILSNH